MEKNYDFLSRHWQVHKPGRRRAGRRAADDEVMPDGSWQLACAPDAPEILLRALEDFQDYLRVSMELSLPVTRERNERTLFLSVNENIGRGFVIRTRRDAIDVELAFPEEAFRAVCHIEDIMNLEGAPVLRRGELVRRPLYDSRTVHSGSGIDNYPDSELCAAVHAGYTTIILFLKDFDMTAAGKCDVNDVIRRAGQYGLKVLLYNYIPTFIHPDDPKAEETFDAVYGEIFRRYPDAMGITLCGESLEFPSKDPAVTGKRYNESVTDGIPDTRPSPGWYPCEDYPRYLAGIERAIHRVKPDALISFSTYNWGWAPLELRRKFLEKLPKGITLCVCFEIFSQHTLEGLRTPVMDYTISVTEPGYYFKSECETAAHLGIPLRGNVNTAGISWSFGTVPWVPVPGRWLARDRYLRKAKADWNVSKHYTTHHYGWWASPAADLGRWSAWEDFEPDYDELLKKIAVRDYGEEAAPGVLAAWKLWDEAMAHYTASNEDQYGPWRVGPAYPFIFQPNITRTMQNKEIRFPTAPGAHFGWRIIKTFYQPYENEHQAPGFLRYPAEIRSLEKMLALWEKGEQAASAASGTEEGQRLIALGHFIRNSIRTTINIKRWWLLNIRMQCSSDAAEARALLDRIEALAREEIANARDTIACTETDSRLGWEPSMEYVCDPWHLNWKIRQVESALREIQSYRKVLDEK
ncbi:MAG: hypothetical protein IJS01_06150 [Lentisphaeria bacterium]|nr:hypothetical protein [Lentisphaeria bacterium]